MKKEIIAIQERNKRVEIDKAWETSKTRKLIISILTYLVVVIFLIMIKAPCPLLNALIPVIGFILSTLTINYLKKRWINRFYK